MRLANGSSVKTSTGERRTLQAPDGTSYVLTRVLKAPNFRKHLISISQITLANGCRILFTPEEGYIMNAVQPPSHLIRTTFHQHAGQYRVHLAPAVPKIRTKPQALLITPHSPHTPPRSPPLPAAPPNTPSTTDGIPPPKPTQTRGPLSPRLPMATP